jgi:hypothetical protein
MSNKNKAIYAAVAASAFCAGCFAQSAVSAALIGVVIGIFWAFIYVWVN